MNLPTKITLIRIALIPAMVAVYYIPWEFSPLIAALIFVLASITDFLDGYLARKNNLVTDLGKFLDPIADKLLVLFGLLLILDSGTILSPFGVIAVGIILGREFIISCLRQIAAIKGTALAADAFGKVKAVFQYISIPMLMAASVLEMISEHIIYGSYGIFAIAVLLTILSGINYIVRNRTVFRG